MQKQEFEQNLQIFLNFYKAKQAELNNLKAGLNEESEERIVLDSFLNFLDLEINDETRYAAYMRLGQLKEDALKLILEKNGKSSEEIPDILYEAYIFVKNYHNDIFSEIISFAQDEQLFTEFYLEILKWVQKVGEAFTDFYLAWHSHIIETVNKNLEAQFDNNSEEIFKYLSENNLWADKIDGVSVDRSYSALIETQTGHEVATYSQAFPIEINDIAWEFENFISKLENLEDEIYNRKNEYIEYLTALKNAFSEKDIDKVVNKWRIVEQVWMKIDTPFQIGHPLEFYEDLYRKAVAPEWDIRIVDTSVLESVVESDMKDMYETLYDDIGRCKYETSYNYSKENMNRVQLYVSTPVLYFWAEFCGLFSAQVVPNDEVVSEAHGKKIFAFPGFVLESQRSLPKMQITQNIFEVDFIKKHQDFIQNDAKRYFEIYDIETIWHEFGHTLWLDLDTENMMNETGNFKNIEEFKATAGGLVAYFMKWWDENLNEDVIMTHVYRSIGLMKYRKIEDIVPYYCEALIHLDILFESGIISFNWEKILSHYSEENYKKVSELYITHYKKLIYTYLEKQSADVFLYDYAVKEGKYFFPKNKDVRKFVEYYYDMYEKIGNQTAK